MGYDTMRAADTVTGPDGKRATLRGGPHPARQYIETERREIWSRKPGGPWQFEGGLTMKRGVIVSRWE